MKALTNDLKSMELGKAKLSMIGAQIVKENSFGLIVRMPNSRGPNILYRLSELGKLKRVPGVVIGYNLYEHFIYTRMKTDNNDKEYESLFVRNKDRDIMQRYKRCKFELAPLIDTKIVRIRSLTVHTLVNYQGKCFNFNRLASEIKKDTKFDIVICIKDGLMYIYDKASVQSNYPTFERPREKWDRAVFAIMSVDFKYKILDNPIQINLNRSEYIYL